MARLVAISHIYAILHLGPIICWAVAIGAEYAVQIWDKRKFALNILAACTFLLALSGEAVGYEYDVFHDPGTQVSERFTAKDANEETFTVSQDPITGSVEVLINGLPEAEDIYSAQGRDITVLTKLTGTDVITVKYRHRSE